MGNVEFISYDGEYPNLCRGNLILKILGKEYNFGHDYDFVDGKWQKIPGRYSAFWYSGGGVYHDGSYQNWSISSGNWEIDEDELPEELRQFAKEIYDVINENMPQGCCGGCI